MNQQEMTDIVTEELTHIPSGYGARHGWLRTYYNRYRRRFLAKGKTKEEALAYCIDLIRKEDPKWNPEYDITFFKMDNFNSKW
jgi:hypothetical protein